MSGCGTGGGCGVGNSYNPGQYVGIRINEHEDGRNVLCDTMGVEVTRGQRVIVEADTGMEYAEVTNLRPMILKQCQLRDSRRLVRVASETDLSSYKAKVGREARFLSDTRPWRPRSVSLSRWSGPRRPSTAERSRFITLPRHGSITGGSFRTWP